jgi:plasmid replication initiation protein
LSSNISEKKTVEPTVYLVIHNTEAKKYGLSWTIRIRMQDRADYILDVVADPKSRKGYYVHEERPQDAILTSKFFKAIKVGTIPTNGGWAEHALEHVLCFFKTCELDKTKPHGVSIIWVTEVLERSKMLGFLCYESGATEKIEQKTRQLEKKMKSAKATGLL